VHFVAHISRSLCEFCQTNVTAYLSHIPFVNFAVIWNLCQAKMNKKIPCSPVHCYDWHGTMKCGSHK